MLSRQKKGGFDDFRPKKFIQRFENVCEFFWGFSFRLVCDKMKLRKLPLFLAVEEKEARRGFSRFKT